MGLGFHPPPGQRKTLSFCLSICLSVTLLNVRVCAPDFAMKRLKYRNDFDAVGQGKVVVYPRSTFSDCRQMSTQLNAEVLKTAKIAVFRRQRATE